MNGMSSKPLNINDVPKVTIGAGKDSSIVRLASTLWKENSIVKNNLDKRLNRSRLCGALLRALLARWWGSLRCLAADYRRDQLSQKRVACYKNKTKKACRQTNRPQCWCVSA